MFGLGEIQNFLPEDIDLTDDEVFRETRRWNPDRGRDLKNNPPWESPNSSGIYFTTSSSSRISTWINTITSQDRDILIDNDLLDGIVEIQSDNELDTLDPVGSNTFSTFRVANAWTNDITATSSTSNSISFVNNNATITYRVDGGITLPTYVTRSKRIKYSDFLDEEELTIEESEEYKNFIKYYKDMPFSPVFKREKSSVSDIASYRKISKMKGLLFGDTKIESVDLSSLRYNLDEIYETVLYRSISGSSWISENLNIDSRRKKDKIIHIPFGKYDWEDDYGYYEDLKKQLPWLDRRANNRLNTIIDNTIMFA